MCVCVCDSIQAFPSFVCSSSVQTSDFDMYLLHVRHLIFCFEIKCCHKNEHCMEMPKIILINNYCNSCLVMLVVCRIHVCICQ
jgi:hypothetical protein